LIFRSFVRSVGWQQQQSPAGHVLSLRPFLFFFFIHNIFIAFCLLAFLLLHSWPIFSSSLSSVLCPTAGQLPQSHVTDKKISHNTVMNNKVLLLKKTMMKNGNYFLHHSQIHSNVVCGKGENAAVVDDPAVHFSRPIFFPLFIDGWIDCVC
jgi:hypothetical protein